MTRPEPWLVFSRKKLRPHGARLIKKYDIMDEKRLGEIKEFLVFKINEAADAMWETRDAAEKLKWKAVKDTCAEIYKRIYNEVYYDR